MCMIAKKMTTFAANNGGCVGKYAQCFVFFKNSMKAEVEPLLII